MINVTAIGDVNVDVLTQPIKSLPQRDKQMLLSEAYLTIGGGAANFALQSTRLDLKTRLIGLVGDDLYGRYVKSELVKNGVDFCVNLTRKEKTGISLGIEFVNGTKILLTYRGANRIFSIKDFSLSKIKGKALHLAGYNFLDNFRGDMPKIVRYAKNKGMFVSVDPDLKSGINFDRLKFFKLLREVNVLFVNGYELKLLTGKNVKDSIDFLLKRGLEMVVVKLGSKGCVAANRFTRVRRKVIKILPKTSTGAGDIFDAGFIYEYLKNGDLKSACVFANATAICSLSKYGIERYPKIREVLRVMRKYEKD